MKRKHGGALVASVEQAVTPALRRTGTVLVRGLPVDHGRFHSHLALFRETFVTYQMSGASAVPLGEVDAFGSVFDRVIYVTPPDRVPVVLAELPEWVGIGVLEGDARPRLALASEGSRSPHVTVAARIHMLWKPESAEVLRRLGCAVGNQATWGELRQLIEARLGGNEEVATQILYECMLTRTRLRLPYPVDGDVL